MTELMMMLAMMNGQAQNIDYRLVLAVMQVESNYNENAVGSKGEVGLMQLMPNVFKVNVKELKKPNKNIALGTKHLAEARTRCRHKKGMTFLVCYNAGIKGGSRIVNARDFPYYKKVMKAYASLQKSLPPLSEIKGLLPSQPSLIATR